MRVVETLVMGTNHRLVLVRLDGEERLVLLGEGSLLAALPPKEAA
jgi:flagellar protein FliO/FliZ